MKIIYFVATGWFGVKAQSPSPTSSPTFGQHCKRAGECIDLDSSKFCCTGNCRLVASSDCGYRCLAADVDDSQASDDIAVCNYHSRYPTHEPTTFQPTTSDCLRAGECMVPNSTCCSGKCHNADQKCPYHYRCNSWEDDDTGDIQTNEYCLDNLKKVHSNDNNDPDWGILACVIISVACIIIGLLLLSKYCWCPQRKTVVPPLANTTDEYSYRVMGDDGVVTDLPAVKGELVTDHVNEKQDTLA